MFVVACIIAAVQGTNPCVAVPISSPRHIYMRPRRALMQGFRVPCNGSTFTLLRRPLEPGCATGAEFARALEFAGTMPSFLLHTFS